MALSTQLLLAEANRLIFRAERHVESSREYVARLEVQSLDTGEAKERTKRAERELKRLELYRSVLKNSNSAEALMPEYVLARGLVQMERRRGVALLTALADHSAST